MLRKKHDHALASITLAAPVIECLCFLPFCIKLLGKIRPTPPGVADFLLDRITAGTAPAIVTSMLAALLQLDPPVDDQLVGWTARAAALDAVCRAVDRQTEALVGTRETPRASKYLEALIARWRATSS